MEGSGTGQPIASPPPAAPRNKRTIIAVVIVVAVVAVVGILAVVLLSGGLTGTNASGTWDPQVGQYLDYSMGMGGSSYATIHMLVKATDATTITWNETATVMGSTTMQDVTVPKTQTAGSTFDVNNLPSGYSMTNQGKTTISTAWGGRNCDHYHITYSSGGVSGTMDMYLYGNILVKMDASGSGTTMTMTLTGSNAPLITNG